MNRCCRFSGLLPQELLVKFNGIFSSRQLDRAANFRSLSHFKQPLFAFTTSASKQPVSSAFHPSSQWSNIYLFIGVQQHDESKDEASRISNAIFAHVGTITRYIGTKLDCLLSLAKFGLTQLLVKLASSRLASQRVSHPLFLKVLFPSQIICIRSPATTSLVSKKVRCIIRKNRQLGTQLGTQVGLSQ